MDFIILKKKERHEQAGDDRVCRAVFGDVLAGLPLPDSAGDRGRVEEGRAISESAAE